MSDIKLSEWIKKSDNNEFTQDVVSMIECGWYDWFCSDNHLWVAYKEFAPKIKQLAKSPKIDVENNYVFFKNNCPMTGPLYDDFRICDMESGDVIFCVSHLKRGCYGDDFGGWEVYGKTENGEFDVLVKGTWKDVKRYFEI